MEDPAKGKHWIEHDLRAAWNRRPGEDHVTRWANRMIFEAQRYLSKHAEFERWLAERGEDAVDC